MLKENKVTDKMQCKNSNGYEIFDNYFCEKKETAEWYETSTRGKTEMYAV